MIAFTAFRISCSWPGQVDISGAEPQVFIQKSKWFRYSAVCLLIRGTKRVAAIPQQRYIHLDIPMACPMFILQGGVDTQRRQ